MPGLGEAAERMRQVRRALDAVRLIVAALRAATDGPCDWSRPPPGWPVDALDDGTLTWLRRHRGWVLRLIPDERGGGGLRLNGRYLGEHGCVELTWWPMFGARATAAVVDGLLNLPAD